MRQVPKVDGTICGTLRTLSCQMWSAPGFNASPKISITVLFWFLLLPRAQYSISCEHETGCGKVTTVFDNGKVYLMK